MDLDVHTSLKQVLMRHDKCPHDVAEAVYKGSAEGDFHRIIARGSGNRWLERALVEDVYSLLRLYRFHGAQRADVSISLAQHHVIVERTALEVAAASRVLPVPGGP